jgi:hypothetical protein
MLVVQVPDSISSCPPHPHQQRPTTEGAVDKNTELDWPQASTDISIEMFSKGDLLTNPTYKTRTHIGRMMHDAPPTSSRLAHHYPTQPS